MAAERSVTFDAVFNFRDLGGYSVDKGLRVSRGRVFRSGELRHATGVDTRRITNEVGIRSVLDLRNKQELESQGVGPLRETAISYHNVPLATDRSIDLASLHRLRDNGELYLFVMDDAGYQVRLMECLDIIANRDNMPLVFHCSAGKDRTGVLAAILLSVLGVADDDVIEDYALTASAMPGHLSRSRKDPDTAKFLDSLPDYMHQSSPASMATFLSALRLRYGSVRGYLRSVGAKPSLFDRLETALLIKEPDV